MGARAPMIQLAFDRKDGLVPVIVQDNASGQVLMLAYMNAEAWRQTLATGKATYFSRSRQKLWIKGETSGHIQRIKAVFIDCDQDTVLLKVEQVGGAACHTGFATCFHRRVVDGGIQTEGQRVFDPAEVYGK